MEFKHTLEAVLHDIEEIKSALAETLLSEQPVMLEIDRIMLRIINVYDLLHLVKNEMTASHNFLHIEKEVSSIQQSLQNIYEGKLKGKEEKSEDKKSKPDQENITKQDLTTPGEKREQKSSIFYEKMRENIKVRDLSSFMQSRSIDNIESAIGLNDKFLFIKELFKGNQDRYSNTISIINHSSNLQEVISFLDNNFNWNKNDYSVNKFYELVYRKFKEN